LSTNISTFASIIKLFYYSSIGDTMQHNVRRYVQLASRCIGTVARVFALVVRCRVMRLLLYSRVGKNRDTKREYQAGAGAGRTADYLTVLFSQKILAVRKSQWHIPTC